MASYDRRNLANTVHATHARRTTRCAVWRPKKYPPYFVLAGEPHDREDAETNYHDWTAGNGHCKFCGLTRAQAIEPAPISLHQALKGN